MLKISKFKSDIPLEPLQEMVSMIDENVLFEEPAYYDGSWWDGMEHHDGDVYARGEVKPILEILQSRVKYLEEEIAKLKGKENASTDD